MGGLKERRGVGGLLAFSPEKGGLNRGFKVGQTNKQ